MGPSAGRERGNGSAVVAAQLTQLALDLRAVGKRQMRNLVAQKIQAIDLVVDRGLRLSVELVDEVSDRLPAVSSAVVDGLQGSH